MQAVKFQKRDMEALLTREGRAAPYTGCNSFGPTYGEHRNALELSIDQMAELKEYSESKGLVFFASAWDDPSLKQILGLDVELLKICSADLVNVPLVRKYAAARDSDHPVHGHEFPGGYRRGPGRDSRSSRRGRAPALQFHLPLPGRPDRPAGHGRPARTLRTARGLLRPRAGHRPQAWVRPPLGRAWWNATSPWTRPSRGPITRRPWNLGS